MESPPGAGRRSKTHAQGTIQTARAEVQKRRISMRHRKEEQRGKLTIKSRNPAMALRAPR